MSHTERALETMCHNSRGLLSLCRPHVDIPLPSRMGSCFQNDKTVAPKARAKAKRNRPSKKRFTASCGLMTNILRGELSTTNYRTLQLRCVEASERRQALILDSLVPFFLMFFFAVSCVGVRPCQLAKQDDNTTKERKNILERRATRDGGRARWWWWRGSWTLPCAT